MTRAGDKHCVCCFCWPIAWSHGVRRVTEDPTWATTTSTTAATKTHTSQSLPIQRATTTTNLPTRANKFRRCNERRCGCGRLLLTVNKESSFLGISWLYHLHLLLALISGYLLLACLDKKFLILKISTLYTARIGVTKPEELWPILFCCDDSSQPRLNGSKWYVILSTVCATEHHNAVDLIQIDRLSNGSELQL